MKKEVKEHPIKTIKRAGVPLAIIETTDAALTIRETLRALNGKTDTMPILRWDCVKGLHGLNTLGDMECQRVEADAMNSQNAGAALEKLAIGTLENGLVFILNAHLILPDPACKQAIWNLRDKFKSASTTLLMLAPSVKLPEELKHDVVSFVEPLPNETEIEEIVDRTLNDAGLPIPDEKTKTKIVSSLLGLNGFASEQSLAMSLTKNGVNIEMILERRRSFISAQSGMEIRTDKIRFSDVAGSANCMEALRLKIAGKRPPGLVIWLDEIEKAFGGANTDSSGTTQDQVASLLTWFQDRLNEDRLSAMLLVGFPGTGKSAIAMATHNEAQCESVRLDMGGMKGSLVGQSEQNIRGVLKTIDALCSGHILVLSTCNSVAGIPAPFISRHAFGTYFFDVPSAEENTALWKLKRSRYGIADTDETPANTAGWTGREIQQACFLASDLSIPLAKACGYIAPFCRSNSADIETLRKQAMGRWISASVPGLYTGPQESKGAGRKMELN